MMLSPQGLALLIASAAPCGAAAALLARRFDGVSRPPSIVLSIAVMAALFGWALLVMPSLRLLLVTCALAWALQLLATVDRLALRLPDPITFPLIICGLLVSGALPGRDVAGHAIGAAAGLAVFALLGWGFQRWRGYEGLGLGDAKLAGAAGAWLGWQGLPSVVLIGCLGGILWALAASVFRRRAVTAELIPFGVPLCLGFWLVWLYGPIELFR
jgi:leader peptidase (prepilin peptidase)/N-methyltransferase